MTARPQPASRDVVFYAPSATALLTAGGRASAGGAENQVVMLARELARRGYAVGIVAFDDANLLDEVDGVDVIAHPRPATAVPVLRTLAFYRLAFSTLRANRATVLVQRAANIHTVVAAVAARGLRCRFAYASAGVHDFDLRTWEPRGWIRRAVALALRRADTIVVQTEEQARLCREHVGRRPVVISSIAEPAPAHQSQPEAFLWIGSLSAHKRPLEFVALARAVPEARFRMVGVPAGAEDAELRHAARDVPNLELLAPRPRAELARLLERAVAIVSTSRSEGMPNVFLEAWSRGVPALALEHDPDGVLEREALGACAHGSAARLAALVRSAWDERADREQQAARCRGYVARHHALGQIADEWIRALELASGAR